MRVLALVAGVEAPKGRCSTLEAKEAVAVVQRCCLKAAMEAEEGEDLQHLKAAMAAEEVAHWQCSEGAKEGPKEVPEQVAKLGEEVVEEVVASCARRCRMSFVRASLEEVVGAVRLKELGCLSEGVEEGRRLI